MRRYRSPAFARVLRAAFVFVAAALCALAAPATDPPGAVPLDIAFSRRQLPGQDRAEVSHDGRWLAYDRHTPPVKSPGSSLEAEPRILPNGTPASMVGMNVVIADTSTGAERAVCPEKANCWRPTWSPDDRSVAYFSDAGGFAQLYVYDVGNSKSRLASPTRIKSKLWPGDEAAWSPDGKEVFVPISLTEPEPAPGLVTKMKNDGTATVTMYQTPAESGKSTAKETGTPEAMRKHFLRENNATLAAIDVASGRMRIVVPAEAEPRPACLRLSPDGKWVSYLSVFKMKGETASGSYYDIAVAPSAGGPVTVIAADVQVNEDGDYFEATYRWVPGPRIVFLKDKRLWISDVGGTAGAPRPLAADLGNLTDVPLLLTADCRAVIVGLEALGKKTYYHVPARSLAVVPVDETPPRLLNVAGVPLRASEQFLWQSDPGHFHVLQRDLKTAERVVSRVDLASGQTESIWRGHGRFTAVGAGPGGHSLIAQYESVDVSPDYYRFDERFRKRDRVTHVEPRLDGVRVGAMEPFLTTVPAYDGSLIEVQSAAFLPAGRKAGERLPTIVYFYGGSQVLDNAQEYGGGAPNSIPALIFTTRGYAVLLVDVPMSPEGTSGGNPIQEMSEVILPQVLHAASLGITDLNRVAIMGQSYGGYGTASMVTQTNLFRAAIALDGLYDLPGNYGRMEAGGGSFFYIWSETGQGRMGTHPWADLRRYLANSPYYQADKIHTPLLLIHGKFDKTCPVEGAEAMFNALKRLDRRAELAIYDGEGHVPGTWSLVNAVDATNRMIDFLGRHMTPAGDRK